ERGDVSLGVSPKHPASATLASTATQTPDRLLQRSKGVLMLATKSSARAVPNTAKRKAADEASGVAGGGHLFPARDGGAFAGRPPLRYSCRRWPGPPEAFPVASRRPGRREPPPQACASGATSFCIGSRAAEWRRSGRHVSSGSSGFRAS